MARGNESVDGVDDPKWLEMEIGSINKNESTTISQSKSYEYFPEVLPPRVQQPSSALHLGWKSRMRSFWLYHRPSYSILHTNNRASWLRHVGVVSIIIFRTGLSALGILLAAVKHSTGGIVAFSIVAVLSAWSTTTCLTIIGHAEGDKPLWRFRVKRWHFDSFLVFCIIIHIALIIAFFFDLPGWVLQIAGVGMWFAILGVARVAGWQPNLSATARKWIA